MKNLIYWSVFMMMIGSAMGQAPTAGLVVYYPFTNILTNSVPDISINSLNGSIVANNQFSTFTSSVTSVTDKNNVANNALSFPLLNGFYLGNGVLVPHNNLLNFNSSYSFSLWTNFEANTSFDYEMLFAKGRDVNNSYQLAYKPSTHEITFFHNNGNGTQYLTTATKDLALNDAWVNISGSLDVPSKQMKIYIDGVLAISTTFSSVNIITNNTFGLSIGFTEGARQAGYGYQYNGKIDEVRFYNRTLTDCEIAQLAGLTIASPSFTSSNPSSANVGQTTTYTISPVTSATSYVWKIDNTVIPTATSTSFSKTWTSGEVGNRVVSVFASNNNCISSNTITSNINIGNAITGFDLISSPSVRNDTLFLRLGMTTNGTPFYLGSTSISLNLTAAGLNISAASLIGTSFGQGPSYSPVSFITSPGNITIGINPITTAGPGNLISTTTAQIATIAIPFTLCPTGSTSVFASALVKTFSGQDISSVANLISLPAPNSTIPVSISSRATSYYSSCATLTANPGTGFTYAWSTGSTLRTTNIPSGGLYTLTVTQIAGGCKAATSRTLLLPATVCIGISPVAGAIDATSKPMKFDTTYRCDVNFQLQINNCSGTGTFNGANFSWRRVDKSTSVSNNLGNGNAAKIVNAPIDASYYYVVTGTDNGCTSPSLTDTAYIYPYPSYTVNLVGYGSNNIPVPGLVGTCPYDTIRLEATNTSTITSYTWRKPLVGNNSITGITIDTYKVVADVNGYDQYSATIISPDGCPFSQSIIIEGYTTGGFNFIKPTTQNLCSNDSILFEINQYTGAVDLYGYNPGPPKDRINWIFGDPGSGASNNVTYSKTSANHAFSAGGTYTVTAFLLKDSESLTKRKCTVKKDTVITIKQKPTVDITVDTVRLCPGNSGTNLLANGTLGGAPYNFIWKGPGNAIISNSQNATYSPSSIGVYTIFASITSDAFNCSSKNVDSVKVLNSAAPVISFTATKDTICPNVAITINSTATGSGKFKHSWFSSPTDPTLVTTTATFINIAPSVTTSYTDTITDKITTCKSYNAKIIGVSDISLSAITTSNFKPYCYSTSNPVTLQTNVLGSVNSKPYKFIWSANLAGAGLSTNSTTSNIPTGTVNALPIAVQSYTFNVQVTDKFNCPTVTASGSLVVNPLPVLTLGSTKNFNICLNETKTLSADATITGGTFPYPTIYWNTAGLDLIGPTTTSLGVPIRPNPTPNVNTIYSVNAEDVNGCISNIDKITVTGIALPNVSLSPNTNFLKGCFGTTQTVSLVDASNATGTIIWTETISGKVLSNSSKLTQDIFSSGVYNVYAFNGTCSNSNQVKASFITPPNLLTLTVNPSVKTNPCSYTILKLNAPKYPTDTISYVWSNPPTNGGGTLTGILTDTVTYKAAPLDDLVSFSYQATNRCGTGNSTPFSIQYKPTPVAILTTSSPETFLNKPMIFTNNSLNTDTPAYLNLGNGSVIPAFPIGVPISIRYNEQGDYITKLKIMNLNGCSDSTTVTIGVIGTKTVFVPNVFSPNANNIDNKAFRVFGTNILSQDFQMTVFNRWGQIVYSTSDFDEANGIGWTGVSASQTQGDGIYTYSVKGKFVDGSPFERVGTVTLLR